MTAALEAAAFVSAYRIRVRTHSCRRSCISTCKLRRMHERTPTHEGTRAHPRAQSDHILPFAARHRVPCLHRPGRRSPSWPSGRCCSQHRPPRPRRRRGRGRDGPRGPGVPAGLRGDGRAGPRRADAGAGGEAGGLHDGEHRMVNWALQWAYTASKRRRCLRYRFVGDDACVMEEETIVRRGDDACVMEEEKMLRRRDDA